MRMSRTEIISIILLLCASQGLCHDFFLFPSRFRVAPGDSVTVFIHVDDLFPGRSTKWNPARVTRFELWRTNDPVFPLPSKLLADSSGTTLTISKKGIYTCVLDWSPRLIELKASDFNAYLRAEGLDDILALRKEQNLESKPGRERYSRYVKTFINCNSSPGETPTNYSGQTIELVLLDNPYHKSVEDSLHILLSFRGQPLSNALVSATHAGFTEKPDTYKQSVRTDANGFAWIHLDAPGPWLVRTVHMLPLMNSNEADWESWWASATFEVKDRAPTD